MDRQILIPTLLVLALGVGSLGYAWFDSHRADGVHVSVDSRGVTVVRPVNPDG